MAARYRDRETGRFVSRETWTRSKSHGGTKFVREYIRRETAAEREERIEREEIERAIEEEELEQEEEEIEYAGAFDSP